MGNRRKKVPEVLTPPGGAAASSGIYTGSLRHRRMKPRPHQFRRTLFMVYLDLSELQTVFRGRWFWSTQRPSLAWLRRADYLGDPNVPLDTAVRNRVLEQTGVRPSGPIRVLTHLRYWGHCFNPVTFYYCFDAGDSTVESIVAEITNTPWSERHSYVLHRPDGCDRVSHRFEKAFHVSPFMEPDLEYQWSFTRPGRRLGVHMRNLKEGVAIFDATLTLERHEIETSTLARVLLLFPFMTVQVLASIYWHALRLWLKGTPTFSHATCAGPNSINQRP
jgi:uncharacterized protein